MNIQIHSDLPLLPYLMAEQIEKHPKITVTVTKNTVACSGCAMAGGGRTERVSDYYPHHVANISASRLADELSRLVRRKLIRQR
jgi:hypothetical protein